MNEALVTEPPVNRFSLDDKYELASGRAYLTGTQALVRLIIDQRLRDQAVGLNTAGFVTGFRGSPLAGVDRSGDPFKHANLSGTARHGGVLHKLSQRITLVDRGQIL